MTPSAADIERFQSTVWHYFDAHGRHDLPWRQPDPAGGFDPYAIMVSELMLQQTQVARVIPKYEAFLERFPNAAHLAAAGLDEVLVAWQGLGYNRRAKFLWQAARTVVALPGGRFPDDAAGLVALPGIGTNTAGAILAYAYDRPAVFVETNIRSVYIHHFFDDAEAVHDAQLLPIITGALPGADAPTGSNRRWYWALMDYGTHLKRTTGNAARRSVSHTRQSRFEGSRRQVRGAVLRALAAGPMKGTALEEQIGDDRLQEVLADLEREQLITRLGSRYTLFTE